METKQMFAAFGALAFLGMAALMATAILGFIAAKLIGGKRLARFSHLCTDWLFSGRGLAWKIFMVAAPLLLIYSAALVGASLSRQELTLSPGEEKYFCEIDCHLAYSAVDAKTAGSIGTDASAVKARGRFVVVSVRTRFDEMTISRNRGDGPLVPSPREIFLLDSAGKRYAISDAGQQALTAISEAGISMMQPLRPGESYISRVVFDLPSDIANPRLLIDSPMNPRFIGAVYIGNEDSLWHKKVFLALGPVQSP